MEANEAKKTVKAKTTTKKTTTSKAKTEEKAETKVEAKTTTKRTTTRKTTATAKAAKVEKAPEAKVEVKSAPKATKTTAKKEVAKKEIVKRDLRDPRATLKNARISARKVKIVIDNIRGKNVDEALAILKFTPKAASPLVEKLLNSAIANAVNNNNMDRSKLYISEVYANQGTTMKRIRAATQGRANRIRKRTSHITVVLKERV